MGGAEMRNGLVPHPNVVDKNSGGTSQEQEVPAPHQDPRLGFLWQEDKSPQLINQWIESVQKLLESQAVPLKDLTHSDSLPEVQRWGSGLKGTSRIQGETEVSGIKARDGGQLSTRQKGGQRPLCLYWTLPPQSQSWQVGAMAEPPSTWLTLFALPWRSLEALFHPTWSF